MRKVFVLSEYIYTMLIVSMFLKFNVTYLCLFQRTAGYV